MRSGVAPPRDIIIKNKDIGSVNKKARRALEICCFQVPPIFQFGLHDNGTEAKARDAER